VDCRIVHVGGVSREPVRGAQSPPMYPIRDRSSNAKMMVRVRISLAENR